MTQPPEYSELMERARERAKVVGNIASRDLFRALANCIERLLLEHVVLHETAVDAMRSARVVRTAKEHDAIEALSLLQEENARLRGEADTMIAAGLGARIDASMEGFPADPIGEGWVMVPRKPDGEQVSLISKMVRRMAIPTSIDPDEVYFDTGHARRLYVAAVSAAPPSPVSSLQKMQISPEPGWRAVPVEPTPEMIAAVAPCTEQPTDADFLLADAAERLLPPVSNRTQARYALAEIARDYRAMLAASPAPPVKGEG